jgi:hypothetical protein
MYETEMMRYAAEGAIFSGTGLMKGRSVHHYHHEQIHKLACIRTEDALFIIIKPTKTKQPDPRKDEIRD